MSLSVSVFPSPNPADEAWWQDFYDNDPEGSPAFSREADAGRSETEDESDG